MTTSRNLGILTGAAIAVAVLIVAVGVPEFGRVADTVPVESSAPPPPGAAAALAEPPEAAAAPATLQREPRAAAHVAQAEPIDRLPPQPTAPEPELHWHSFWSPFGSQVAANGFVSRLQRVTGLDYRVVRIEPGVFEVAFAYASEEEVTAGLALISAATGLELPES